MAEASALENSHSRVFFYFLLEGFAAEFAAILITGIAGYFDDFVGIFERAHLGSCTGVAHKDIRVHRIEVLGFLP
ncbi:hypothetical protein [Advenella mimigardefordensis]|uniref:hypothetical protein n=1 Tax=Advenella mimigardefordensis TaxID=302406 RepID=UPI00130EB0B4|nr:hypothetical protein [Advenella mimigardefordensis]